MSILILAVQDYDQGNVFSDSVTEAIVNLYGISAGCQIIKQMHNCPY